MKGSRRRFLRGIGMTSGLAALPAGVSAASPSGEPETDIEVEKTVMVDNDRVTIARVRVDRTIHVFKEFNSGPMEGEVHHANLGKTEGNGGGAGDEITTLSYDYDDFVKRKESYSKTLNGCAEWSSYDHLYKGMAVELTDSVDSLSKNTLVGLLALLAKRTVSSTLLGILAGTILDLYTDDTFSIGSKDDDLLGQPIVYLIVGGAYKADPSNMYAIQGSVGGHIETGDDPNTIIL